MVLEKPPAMKVFQQQALETIKLHLHDVPFNDIEVLKAHKTKLCKKTKKLSTLCFVLYGQWKRVCMFSELVLCVYRKLATARWKL